MTILETLVEQVAEGVKAQSEAIHNDDVKNAGRDALTALLEHSHPNVRVTAAVYLLRYRTAESKAVLEAAVNEGKGLASLGAELTLKRWEDGTWTWSDTP